MRFVPDADTRADRFGRLIDLEVLVFGAVLYAMIQLFTVVYIIFDVAAQHFDLREMPRRTIY